MEWRNGVRCPVCGSKSEVATGKPPERWRKCLNRRCEKMWRTQEILVSQANELSTWYAEVVEARGGGWGPLYKVATEVYDRAVELGLMLGVLEEGSYGSKQRDGGEQPVGVGGAGSAE